MSRDFLYLCSMKRNSIRKNILKTPLSLFVFKQRRIRRYQLLQAIIFFFFFGVITGILMVGAANLLSLKFSATAMLCTVATSYFLLQSIRPLRYKALVITRRQRDKAMRKAEELKSKRIIVQNFNNMNIFGDNNGTIYGDNAVHNETHHHYGSEQETRVNMEGGLSPYVTLLRKMMAPLRESGNWGTILCPYKAAVIEGVLPKWPHKFFCSQMGVQVPSSSYSEWMKDGRHAEDDLEPYSEEFRKLKHEIDNSK